MRAWREKLIIDRWDVPCCSTKFFYWLIRGCFVNFEKYSTLPVGSLNAVLDNSLRSGYSFASGTIVNLLKVLEPLHNRLHINPALMRLYKFRQMSRCKTVQSFNRLYVVRRVLLCQLWNFEASGARTASFVYHYTLMYISSCSSLCWADFDERFYDFFIDSYM